MELCGKKPLKAADMTREWSCSNHIIPAFLKEVKPPLCLKHSKQKPHHVSLSQAMKKLFLHLEKPLCLHLLVTNVGRMNRFGVSILAHEMGECKDVRLHWLSMKIISNFVIVVARVVVCSMRKFEMKTEEL